MEHPDQSLGLILSAMAGVGSATFAWCGAIYSLRLGAWLDVLPFGYRSAAPIRWTSFLVRHVAYQFTNHVPVSAITIPTWATACLLISATAGVGVGFVVRLAARIPGETIIAGPDVFQGGRRRGDGVEVTPGWRVNQTEEVEHFLALAGSGGGKTTQIMDLVRQARARGDRLLILDFKRDYIQALLTPSELPTVLIAPWDKRSARWQIGEDLRTTPAIDEFLAAVIPDGREAQWARGARSIAEGVIAALIDEQNDNWGFGDLVASLTTVLLDLPALRGVAATFAPETLLSIDTSAATRTSFLTNIGQALSQLNRIAAAESLLPAGRKWSVRRWLATPSATVLLGWLPEGPTMSRSLALPAIQSAVTALLSLPDCSASDALRRTWLFLDEIGQVGKVPALTSALTGIRSKGTRIVLGLQSLAQVEQEYSKPEASTWLGQAGTKLISRLQSTEDQKTITDLIGRHTVERATTSFSVSPSGSRSYSTSYQQSDRDAVRRDEIGALGPRGDTMNLLVLRNGKTWRQTIKRRRGRDQDAAQAPAVVATDYLTPPYSRPNPATLGHIVSLERFRRLAPPDPNSQGAGTVPPRRG